MTKNKYHQKRILEERQFSPQLKNEKKKRDSLQGPKTEEMNDDIGSQWQAPTAETVGGTIPNAGPNSFPSQP